MILTAGLACDVGFPADNRLPDQLPCVTGSLLAATRDQEDRLFICIPPGICLENSGSELFTNLLLYLTETCCDHEYPERIWEPPGDKSLQLAVYMDWRAGSEESFQLVLQSLGSLQIWFDQKFAEASWLDIYFIAELDEMDDQLCRKSRQIQKCIRNFHLIPTYQHLYKLIHREDCPVELGGNVKFHMEDWTSYRMKLDTLKLYFKKLVRDEAGGDSLDTGKLDTVISTGQDVLGYLRAMQPFNPSGPAFVASQAIERSVMMVESIISKSADIRTLRHVFKWISNDASAFLSRADDVSTLSLCLDMLKQLDTFESDSLSAYRTRGTEAVNAVLQGLGQHSAPLKEEAVTLQEALNRIQETLESRKRDLEGVKERLERELAEEEQKKEWHQLHKEVTEWISNVASAFLSRTDDVSTLSSCLDMLEQLDTFESDSLSAYRTRGTEAVNAVLQGLGQHSAPLREEAETLQEALNRIPEALESRKRDLEGVKERLERELAEEEQKKEWHQLHKEVTEWISNVASAFLSRADDVSTLSLCLDMLEQLDTFESDSLSAYRTRGTEAVNAVLQGLGQHSAPLKEEAVTLQEALNRIQETLESRKRDLEGVKERLERELAEEEQKKNWHQLHEEIRTWCTSCDCEVQRASQNSHTAAYHRIRLGDWLKSHPQPGQEKLSRLEHLTAMLKQHSSLPLSFDEDTCNAAAAAKARFNDLCRDLDGKMHTTANPVHRRRRSQGVDEEDSTSHTKQRGKRRSLPATFEPTSADGNSGDLQQGYSSERAPPVPSSPRPGPSLKPTPDVLIANSRTKGVASALATVEEEYCTHLANWWKRYGEYWKELDDANALDGGPSMPEELQNATHLLYEDLSAIQHFHQETVLKQLQDARSNPHSAARALNRLMADFCRYYVPYFCHWKYNQDLLKKTNCKVYFETIYQQRKAELRLEMYHYLPSHRLEEYKKSMEDMKKALPDDLEQASRACDDAIRGLHSLIKHMEILKTLTDMANDAMLSVGGLVSIHEFDVKDLSSRFYKPRTVLLFEKILLVTKKDDTGYHTKNELRVENIKRITSQDAVCVQLEANIKKDNLSFKIRSREWKDKFVMDLEALQMNKKRQKKGLAHMPSSASTSSAASNASRDLPAIPDGSGYMVPSDVVCDSVYEDPNKLLRESTDGTYLELEDGDSIYSSAESVETSSDGDGINGEPEVMNGVVYDDVGDIAEEVEGTYDDVVVNHPQPSHNEAHGHEGAHVYDKVPSENGSVAIVSDEQERLEGLAM